MSQTIFKTTEQAAILSCLPTIVTYGILFDDGERAGDDFGKKYLENYWLRHQPAVLKPLSYLGAGILLLLTTPVSLFFLTISLPLALLRDAVVGISTLINSWGEKEPDTEPTLRSLR